MLYGSTLNIGNGGDMFGLMLKRLGLAASVAALACLAGCDLNGPNKPTEPVVQNPQPIDLLGDWQGTLTWVADIGIVNPKYESFPIEFNFTDSNYKSYGARLHANGIYERYGDSLLVLHNDLFYAAIWDLRRLPASYHPLRLEVDNDTLFMTTSGTAGGSQWRGWQRIALVRADTNRIK